MAKVFHGRVVVPGSVRAEALVSHGGLNTLASFQKALMFGDKRATCSDQNNPDLYGKPMAGRALCLPQTIGSTTGGMVLFCATVREATEIALTSAFFSQVNFIWIPPFLLSRERKDFF